MKTRICLLGHLFRSALFAILGSLPWTSAAVVSAGDPPSAPVDPFAQNKRLARGVNVLGYDPLWQGKSGRFKEKYFRAIKDAGFSHVRINLHPFRDGKADAHYQIGKAWFDTLDWAVAHALAVGLMPILDFHEFNVLGEDPEGNHERFLAMWRQIAEHCRSAPSGVLFEILNEPNKKLTPEVWNRWLREALAIIRKSNPTRTVIVGPTSFNNIKDLDKLDLPGDDRNLIVTIHYYSPFPFTHQGASWTSQKDKLGVKWEGTPEERQAIEKDFDNAQHWAEKHHRPMYLGEFGALEKGDLDSRVRWTSFVTREAEKRGWSWGYWQFEGNFIVYDVTKDQWVEPIRRALLP
jgi:endoglucanase